MNSIGSVEIKRVTVENYHMYDDMVFWRLNDRERTTEEKEKSRAIKHARVYKELSKPGFYVFAAEYESRFIGWIHMLYIPKIAIGRWSNGIVYVDELWTSPEYRQLGIGTKLFEKVHEIKDELGAERIRLYTDNPIAEKLYQKCGLKTINTSLYMETEK